MTKTSIICDICGDEILVSDKNSTNSKNHKVTVPVIFHTNQTDGRSVEPYISFESMDICNKCLMKLTNLHADGCQGYNEYYWDTEIDKI